MPELNCEFSNAVLCEDESDKKADLIRHSLPGLYSLRLPTNDLKEIFPGLTEIERRSVPNLNFNALEERLELGSGTFKLLIDFPGEEYDLLTRLEKRGLLERADAVRLRCGAECYFEGAKPASELKDWLAERGFQLTHCDESDSAWPMLDFAADRVNRRISALERDLADRDAALEKAKAEATDTAKRLQDAQAQIKTAQATAEAAQKDLADRDAALEKAKAEATDTAKRLQDAQAQIKTAQATAEAAQKDLADRDAALEKAKAEATDTAKRLQDAQAQIKTAQATAEAAQKDLADRDAALEKAKAEATDTAKRLQDAQAQIKTTQATAEAAQKDLADRDAALEKAKAEATDTAKRLQDTQAQIKTTQATAEAAQKDLADRDAALEKAKAEATETAKRLQALTDEARRLRIKLRESDELAQRARADFDQMRADQGTLLSVLQARVDELSVLRNRHQRLSDEKQELVDLLGKLTPRLQEAATQLRSLALLPGESYAEGQATSRKGLREPRHHHVDQDL
ncbi:hypothetical protein [Paracoccus sanguinis]|uniref:hypothetical protein n=1 Tax=Paracoccus sanguinis TaxID=1545044 RepID=UPI0012E0A99F|nr:hypothetical protein [Paracoccus sanguinis]